MTWIFYFSKFMSCEYVNIFNVKHRNSIFCLTHKMSFIIKIQSISKDCLISFSTPLQNSDSG
jgi:hypothetical protein